jgi:hypothetical protein
LVLQLRGTVLLLDKFVQSRGIYISKAYTYRKRSEFKIVPLV